MSVRPLDLGIVGIGDLADPPEDVLVHRPILLGREDVKLTTICMRCFQEQGYPSDEAIEIEFTHDDKLIGKCSKGHEAPIGVQEQDFQILFDLGCMAMLDGYSREAVTSIAVALERAYMFYVNCVLSGARKRDEAGTSDDGAPKLTEEMQEFFLKQVSKQSERQLGAFLVMYTLHERERPPLLAGNWIEFRNNCVHKGHIPAKARVHEYAEAVLGIMDRLVDAVKAKHAAGLQLETLRHLVSAGASTTAGIPTIVRLTPEPSRGVFSARLDELKKYRHSIWSN